MQIVNKTAYRTDVIRKLLSATYEHMAKTEGRLRQWTGGLTITINYSRSPCVSGHAGRWAATLSLVHMKPVGAQKLWVGKEDWPRTTMGDFVDIAYHELMHLYGYGHRQFYEISQEEQAEILAPLGHTLKDELPIILSEDNTMQVKISGTTTKAIASFLKDEFGKADVKEVKRGKGVITVITTDVTKAQKLLERIKKVDNAENGLDYETRYAARVDFRRLDKQLSQADQAGEPTQKAGQESE